MRISLADSRTNGFKKWSDAQRPPDGPPANDFPIVQKQADDPSLSRFDGPAK